MKVARNRPLRQTAPLTVVPESCDLGTVLVRNSQQLFTCSSVSSLTVAASAIFYKTVTSRLGCFSRLFGQYGSRERQNAPHTKSRSARLFLARPANRAAGFRPGWPGLLLAARSEEHTSELQSRFGISD